MSDEEFKNRDFVYAGRRILKSDIIGHAVFPIGDDQQLMAERLYKLKPRLGFAIGGVYGGAQFAETKSYGVEKGFYKSQWHDKETAIGWEAQDHEAELSLSIIRLENNAKRQSE